MDFNRALIDCRNKRQCTGVSINTALSKLLGMKKLQSGLKIIFQPEEYVTSSVLGQGVNSPSLILVIGARNFKQILNTFLRYK
jgi:hypothetical protein